MSGRDVSCILVRDGMACLELKFVVILSLFVTFEIRYIVEFATCPKLDPTSVVSDIILNF